MTASITLGPTTLHPTLVLGYRSIRTSGNQIHPILNREDPDVTFAPAGLRTGTLRFLCDTLADAAALEQLHTNAGTFSFEDDDAPGVAMYYVPAGDIEMELDPDTRQRWTVSIDFQEVTV